MDARVRRPRWKLTSSVVFTVVALLGAVLLVVGIMRNNEQPWGDEQLAVPSLSSSANASAERGQGQAPSQTAGGEKTMAHIVGAVHQPGVVALPEGSRVFEYVDAAGGLRDDAAPESVNFAAVVHDGEQIVIAHREETNGSPSLATSARSGPPEVSSPQRGKVNLNTADLEQLDALPRIGKVLAQRIIDWRKEHRRFSSIEQLRSVDGIGSKLLETLRSWVTV